MSGRIIKFIFENEKPERLDKALRDHFINISLPEAPTRTKIQELIKLGFVMNGPRKAKKSSELVESGTEIVLSLIHI